MKTPFGFSAQRTEVSNTDTDLLSYANGFAPAYESPIDDGGKFVSRKDMNGFGYMATQNPFYMQAGGLNTFDQKFAHAIGGYPQGAVLDFLVGTRLYKVISLHDDNVVDFTGSDPEFEGIESGTVDDVNWAYANMDSPVDTRFVAGYLPKTLSVKTAVPVLVFKAPITGYVVADGTFDYHIERSGWTYSQPWWGAGFWIKELVNGEDPGVPSGTAPYNGWTLFSALVNVESDSAGRISATVFKVTAGKTYAVASTCGVVVTTDAQPAIFEPSVSNVDMKIYIV